MFNCKWLSPVMAVFVALLLLHQSVYAEIPRQISVQGRLTDASGVNKPDGNYKITFKLFNLETGGISVWDDTLDNITC